MIPSSRRLITYIGSNTLKDFANPELRQVVQQFCEKQENEVHEAFLYGTYGLLQVFRIQLSRRLRSRAHAFTNPMTIRAIPSQ
jgi:hypothetical protein